VNKENQYNIPPEWYLNETFDETIDNWDYGILLYELITLKHPFKGLEEADIINVNYTPITEDLI